MSTYADKPISTSGYFFIIISMVAALAGILFGYDTAVISGAILFINKNFHLTNFQNGIVVASVLLGAAIGSIMSGRMADRFGRKPLLIFVSLIFIVSSIWAAMAQGVYTLIFARILVGIAIGIASYTAPLYISEIAPPQHRGAMVSLNQLAISIGMLIAYGVDYFFASTAHNWRWMFASGALPAIGLLVGMFFLPYSPRWKVANNKINDASRILKRIRGQTNVQNELKAIEESMRVKQKGYRGLFTKVLRPVLIIGIGLAIIQQVTGINTILYYAPTIFVMTGFESNTAAILSSISVGITFVLFTVLSIFLVDRIGRRPLLLWGLAGMCVGLVLLAISFYLKGLVPTELMTLITLLSMLLYIASFSVSLGPIMWLLITEIYPLPIRGVGASLATTVNWVSNMLVALTFLTLTTWLSVSGTFLLYFFLGILSLVFIYKLVPETKCVTLEKIEENLYRRLPSRRLGEHE
jgi:sugar porter (SP) family MFS transporter